MLLPNKKNINLSILQPCIPHYREEFFLKLEEKIAHTDIFIYERASTLHQQGVNVIEGKSRYISNINWHNFLLYNPFPILRGHSMLILPLGHLRHITTWLLLLTKFIHNRKIILWGHGINVLRYIEEEYHPNWKIRLQIALSDGIWLYTEKEIELWRARFSKKPMVALYNSLSGIEEKIAYKPDKSVDELKKQYGITQSIILIFCARFENPYRRVDLLLEAIRRLPQENYGFIIIGGGKYKPDFSIYHNVYDFNSVYDNEIKRDLFAISDLYFQPGWVGLSIVEAMAYGLPICTFVRTKETKQCVEYFFIRDNVNGMLFKDMENCMKRITNITANEMKKMGDNAKNTAKSLTVDNMVERALSIF